MAKKNRSNSSSAHNLQNEIFGVVVTALGVLVLLALATYAETDPPHSSKAAVGNMIGVVGAYLSHYLIFTMGRMASFVVPVLLGFWGYVLLRSADLKQAGIRTGYILAFTVMFCAMISIPSPTHEERIRIGGMAGWGIATFLIKYFKVYGSYIVTTTLLVVLVLLTTEVKLSSVLDAIKTGYLWLHDHLIEGWAAFRKRWTAWNKERKIKAEIRRKEARTRALIKKEQRKKEDAERKAAVAEVKAEARAAAATAAEASAVSAAAMEAEPEEETPAPEPVITKRPAADPAADGPAIGHKKEAKKMDDSAVEEKRKAMTREIKQYQYPGLDIFNVPKVEEESMSDDELMENARILQSTLADFGVEVEVLAVNPGPVITQYEVRPAPGVKVARIVNLSEDLALKMKARGVRVVPNIVGKGAVGIELPNRKPSTVYMRDVIASENFQNAKSLLTLGIGKDVAGDIATMRLDKAPHLLVAGATGSGKSVAINTIITSLVFRASPRQLRFIMVDPKRLELSMYKEIPHLLHPVITESKMVPDALEWAIREMEERYKLLANMSVRDLDSYNEKVKGLSAQQKEEYAEGFDREIDHLPYIVIIIDELAEVMMATEAKVEEPIARLAQMARAVGIHLILATQRPSVDVITGVIKANFPSRIACKVAQRNDSRTILDANGAESLLGNGDMLSVTTEHPKPVRYHGAFVTTEEVERMCNFLRKQKIEMENIDLEEIKKEMAASGPGGMGGGERDELFDEAARLVITHQQGSISLVQRRLKVGYSRAARLIDELEEAGIVGAFEGSKSRSVLVDESYLEQNV